MSGLTANAYHLFSNQMVCLHIINLLDPRLRTKHKDSGTLETVARDLLHLGQILTFLEISELDELLVSGSYLRCP